MNVRDVIASVHSNVGAAPAHGADLRRGYFGAALFAAAVVLAGFAPSYYFKAFEDAPPLSPLLQVHGAVMTAWFVLFIAQTWLVSARRVDWHRRLGIVGAALALLVVVTGIAVGIESARLGLHVPGRAAPLKFLVIPIGTALTFAALVGAALMLRRQREQHRRLMLLATLSILTPPFGRLLRLAGATALGVPIIVLAFALTDLAILASVAADVVRTRRSHPAFAWGCAWILATQTLRLPLAETSSWLQLAQWLTR